MKQETQCKFKESEKCQQLLKDYEKAKRSVYRFERKAMSIVGGLELLETKEAKLERLWEKWWEQLTLETEKYRKGIE